MTVQQLIDKLQQIEDKSLLIIVNDSGMGEANWAPAGDVEISHVSSPDFTIDGKLGVMIYEAT